MIPLNQNQSNQLIDNVSNNQYDTNMDVNNILEKFEFSTGVSLRVYGVHNLFKQFLFLNTI